MAILIFLVLFSSMFINTEAIISNFPGTNCDHAGPDIRLCNLVIKSISYQPRKLQLSDPKNCVQEVFLNLDLSLTALRYFHDVKNYTYYNCSMTLSPPLIYVPCLSGLGHYVYMVESSSPNGSCCRPIKTVAVPFSYNPNFDDDSFGLDLTWDLPDGENCCSAAHVTVLSFIIFTFAVVTLIIMHSYYSKKELEKRLEVEELLKDYDESV